MIEQSNLMQDVPQERMIRIHKLKTAPYFSSYCGIQKSRRKKLINMEVRSNIFIPQIIFNIEQPTLKVCIIVIVFHFYIRNTSSIHLQ